MTQSTMTGCCVFQPAEACLHMHWHGRKWSKTFENNEKSTFFIMHMLTKKNEKKSLLVSDWEWLPKAGWNLKAGCSFGILLSFSENIDSRFLNRQHIESVLKKLKSFHNRHIKQGSKPKKQLWKKGARKNYFKYFCIRWKKNIFS